MHRFKQQSRRARKFIALFVCLTFLTSLITPPAYAQNISIFNLPAARLPAGQGQAGLPAPGAMVSPSPGFLPPIIRGMTIHPDNPLQFDFLVDQGETPLTSHELKEESRKLIKYFLASLTVSDDDQWVNLSPYEKDRIIPEDFGQTEMGRDLLAQDYILKQLTASLMYPGPDAPRRNRRGGRGSDFLNTSSGNVGKDELGKKFWDKVYKKAHERFGTTDIPVDTFNKVWIVPDRAVVYEHGLTAFVADSHLKVMLEEDYLALSESTKDEGRRTKDETSDVSRLTSNIIKEVILPEIEKEINTGENFAQLRQIYNSMILATWFKQNLKQSLLGQVYVDQSKIKGIDLEDKETKDKIYTQYLAAYKKGVYNYIKEDYDPASRQTIPRKYFSGGFDRAQLASLITDEITRNPADFSPAVRDRVDAAMLHAVRTNLAENADEADALALEPTDTAMAGATEEAPLPLIQQATTVAGRILAVLFEDPEKFLSREEILTKISEGLGRRQSSSETATLYLTRLGRLSVIQRKGQKSDAVFGIHPALRSIKERPLILELIRVAEQGISIWRRKSDFGKEAGEYVQHQLGRIETIQSVLNAMRLGAKSINFEDGTYILTQQGNDLARRLKELQKSTKPGFYEEEIVRGQALLLDIARSIARRDQSALEPQSADSAMTARVQLVEDQDALALEPQAPVNLVQRRISETRKRLLRKNVGLLLGKGRGLFEFDGSPEEVNALLEANGFEISGEKEADLMGGVNYRLREQIHGMFWSARGIQHALGGIIVNEEGTRYRDLVWAWEDDTPLLQSVIDKKIGVIYTVDNQALKRQALREKVGGERQKVFPTSLAFESRYAITVDTERDLPAQSSIAEEMDRLARYSVYVQELGQGRVPITELEVSITGDQDIHTSADIHRRVLKAYFDAAKRHGLYLEGSVLKVNMVTFGGKLKIDAPQEVARATVAVHEDVVPPELGAIVFSFPRGQSLDQALRNLNAIVKEAKRVNAPWRYTASFSQAAQESALKVLDGDPQGANYLRARDQFSLTVFRIQAASLGVLEEFDVLIQRIGAQNFMDEVYEYGEMVQNNSGSKDLGKQIEQFDMAMAAHKSVEEYESQLQRALARGDARQVDTLAEELRAAVDVPIYSEEDKWKLIALLFIIEEKLPRKKTELEEEVIAGRDRIINSGGANSRSITQIEMDVRAQLLAQEKFALLKPGPSVKELRDQVAQIAREAALQVDEIIPESKPADSADRAVLSKSMSRYPWETVFAWLLEIISEEKEIERIPQKELEKLRWHELEIGSMGTGQVLYEIEDHFGIDTTDMESRIYDLTLAQIAEEVARRIHDQFSDRAMTTAFDVKTLRKRRRKIEEDFVQGKDEPTFDDIDFVLRALETVKPSEEEISVVQELWEEQNGESIDRWKIQERVVGNPAEIWQELLVTNDALLKTLQFLIDQAKPPAADRAMTTVTDEEATISPLDYDTLAPIILSEDGLPISFKEIRKALHDWKITETKLRNLLDQLVAAYPGLFEKVEPDDYRFKGIRESAQRELRKITLRRLLGESVDRAMVAEQMTLPEAPTPMPVVDLEPMIQDLGVNDSQNYSRPEIAAFVLDRKNQNPLLTEMERKSDDQRQDARQDDQDIIGEIRDNPVSVFGNWAEEELKHWDGSFSRERFIHTRVVNNVERGPGRGGTRWKLGSDLMSDKDFQRVLEGFNRLEGITQRDFDNFIAKWIFDEAKALAMDMTYKNSLAGIKYGGAKGVVLLGRLVKTDAGWGVEDYRGWSEKFGKEEKEFDPWKEMPQETKNKIAIRHGYELAKAGRIGLTKDIPAPDMRSGDNKGYLMALYLEGMLRYIVDTKPEEINAVYPLLGEDLQRISNRITRRELDYAEPHLAKKMASFWLARQEETVTRMRWLGSVAGKPEEFGGIPGRDVATSHSVADSIEFDFEMMGKSLKGATVAGQGYGAAMRDGLVRLAEEFGAVIQVTGNSAITLIKQQGFSADELQMLIDRGLRPSVAWQQGVIDRQGVVAVQGTPAEIAEAVLGFESDILLVGATQNQITEDNQHYVRAQRVHQPANGGVNSIAIKLLHERGIYVSPDILDNLGGVTVSSFETKMVAEDGRQWTREQTAEARRAVSRQASRAVYDLMKKHPEMTPTQVAYRIGVINTSKAKYQRWIDRYDEDLHDMQNGTGIHENVLAAQLSRMGFEGQLRRGWMEKREKLSLEIFRRIIEQLKEKINEEFTEKQLKASIGDLVIWFAEMSQKDPFDTYVRMRTLASALKGETRRQQAKRLEYQHGTVRNQRTKLANMLEKADFIKEKIHPVVLRHLTTLLRKKDPNKRRRQAKSEQRPVGVSDAPSGDTAMTAELDKEEVLAFGHLLIYLYLKKSKGDSPGWERFMEQFEAEDRDNVERILRDFRGEIESDNPPAAPQAVIEHFIPVGGIHLGGDSNFIYSLPKEETDAVHRLLDDPETIALLSQSISWDMFTTDDHDFNHLTIAEGVPVVAAPSRDDMYGMRAKVAREFRRETEKERIDIKKITQLGRELVDLEERLGLRPQDKEDDHAMLAPEVRERALAGEMTTREVRAELAKLNELKTALKQVLDKPGLRNPLQFQHQLQGTENDISILEAILDVLNKTEPEETASSVMDPVLARPLDQAMTAEDGRVFALNEDGIPVGAVPITIDYYEDTSIDEDRKEKFINIQKGHRVFVLDDGQWYRGTVVERGLYVEWLSRTTLPVEIELDNGKTFKTKNARGMIKEGKLFSTTRVPRWKKARNEQELVNEVNSTESVKIKIDEKKTGPDRYRVEIVYPHPEGQAEIMRYLEFNREKDPYATDVSTAAADMLLALNSASLKRVQISIQDFWKAVDHFLPDKDKAMTAEKILPNVVQIVKEMYRLKLESMRREKATIDLGLTEEDVTGDTKLIEELGFNSVMIVEVAMDLEDDFQVDITNESLSHLITARDFAEHVADLIADEAMTAEESSLVTSRSSLATSDQELATPVGGIDLNAANLDLQIKRDGNGVPLPVNLQPLETMNIEGFVPIIINIAPVQNLPMLLGLSTQGMEDETADSVPIESPVIPAAYFEERRKIRELSRL